MLKVILLFLLLVIVWGALWVGLASLVLIPAVGESATSTLGTLLGMLVGWGLMLGVSRTAIRKVATGENWHETTQC